MLASPLMTYWVRKAIQLSVNNKHKPREHRQEEGQARGVHAAALWSVWGSLTWWGWKGV